VPAADVVPLAGHAAAPLGRVGLGGAVFADVESAEEERGTRVVGQFGDPAGQRAAECLGGERVAGDLLAGGEQRLRSLPHPAQGGAGGVHVRLFGSEILLEVLVVVLGRVRGQGHPRRLPIVRCRLT
jgi:hypothetical protein